MSRRKAALATFAGSGSTTLIAGLQSILLLPLYLRTIGTEAYGIWLATGEILLWMVAFDCGIPNLMIQRIGTALAKGNTEIIPKHFASAMAILALAASILAGLVWGLAPTVVHIFAKGNAVPADVTGALRLAAIATGLVLLNYGFQGLARALQKTLWPNLIAVVSTVASFACTFILLLQGYGLDAIAIGLIVRSGGSIFGNIVLYLVSPSFSVARKGFRPSMAITKEYLRETPLLLTSGLAYALMNNSQIAIANLVLGPAAAVLLSVARRIADFVKSLLDMISYSTEGGLAHLYASEDREHTERVLREIDQRFFIVATVLLAGFLATNNVFVSHWTNGHFQPETLLTILIAFRTVLATWSYMGVARLRATGQFRVASGILLGDCAARVALMLAGAFTFGLIGLCIGAVLPPALFGSWARRRLTREIGANPKFDPTLGYLCIGIAATSAAIGILVNPGSLLSAVGLGAAVSGVSGAVLFAVARKPKPVEEPVGLRRAA